MRRTFHFILVLSLVATAIPAFAHEETGWKVPEEANKMKNPVPITKESLERGKEIFEKKCATCHGAKGDGKGPMAARLSPKPTNFHEHHQMEMSGGQFFWKIRTGKGPMPSYKKELTEQETWELVNYISTFGKKK